MWFVKEIFVGSGGYRGINYIIEFRIIRVGRVNYRKSGLCSFLMLM